MSNVGAFSGIRVYATTFVVFVFSMSMAACSHDNAPATSARPGGPSIAEALTTSKQTVDANAWLTYQSSSTHNAVFPDRTLNAAWNVQFDDKINGGFAVVGDVLYTDNFDHAIYALDVRNGQMLWATRTDNVVMSTPVVRNGIVVVGTGHDGWLAPQAPDPVNQIWGRPEGDSVLALSAKTGRLLWRFHTVGDDMASPAIVDDEVVFANGDLHAYELELSSGRLRWKTALAGVASMDSTSIDRGVAFVGTCRAAPHGCETTAIDVRSGKIYWRNPIGSADASPAIAEGTVFTNTLNLDDPHRYNQGGRSTVAAIDEQTGRTKWKWMSKPGPCTFTGSGEHEIAGTVADGIFFDSIGCGSEVVAFDTRNGRVLWDRTTWAHVKMSPVVLDRHVYFGDTNGIFYDLDEKSGKLVRTISFDQLFTAAPPVIVGRTIIVACSSEIYAYPINETITPLDIPRHEFRNDQPLVNDVPGVSESSPTAKD